MKKIFIALLLSTLGALALTVGEVPPKVVLSGENGGTINGTDWNSEMLQGKVHVLFYVDPDKKSDNDAFINALHAKNYDLEKYGSVAIINLKATWLPNFAIEQKLKSKQQEFPDTLYVKDKTKYLVNAWGLADDEINVLIFDPKGILLYDHIGTMQPSDMQTAFEMIEKNLK